jgi:poly-gamma-glutamate capsule biosynthesis protein CapA/YwtB (metallophosphatase superfamily)
MTIGRRTFLKAALLLTAGARPATAAATRLRVNVLGQSLIEHDLRKHPYPGFAALRERLQGADIVFSELETTIQAGEGAAPTRKGVFFHGSEPDVLDCLRELSINVLALSNNHSFDLGPAGIRAAIEETRRRGFTHAGTGANIAAATAPGYGQFGGSTLGLLAFASKVPDGSFAEDDKAGVNHLCLTDGGALDEADRQRIMTAIKAAAQRAQFVIAYHHDHYWEPDWHDTPRWKQLWARACIDAGAHAYVSHGVPLLHGIEIYRGRPIFYSLGSVIFHTHTKVGHYEPAVWETALAQCGFEDGRLTSLRLEPIALNESGEEGANFLATRGRPTFATGAQARAILERLRKISQPFGTELAIGSGYGEIRL